MLEGFAGIPDPAFDPPNSQAVEHQWTRAFNPPRVVRDGPTDKCFGINGRGGRGRTADLLLPKQLRYRCATPRASGILRAAEGPRKVRTGRRQGSDRRLRKAPLDREAGRWGESVS